jgi:hypothetical protein
MPPLRSVFETLQRRGGETVLTGVEFIITWVVIAYIAHERRHIGSHGRQETEAPTVGDALGIMPDDAKAIDQDPFALLQLWFGESLSSSMYE